MMAYSATDVNYLSAYISVESPSPYPLLDNDTSAERRPGRLKLPSSRKFERLMAV